MNSLLSRFLKRFTWWLVAKTRLMEDAQLLFFPYEGELTVYLQKRRGLGRWPADTDLGKWQYSPENVAYIAKITEEIVAFHANGQSSNPSL